MIETSQSIGEKDNLSSNPPIEHGGVQQVEQFDVHGFSSLSSDTADLIRRGLAQLPIINDYEELLKVMKNTNKLSPWWSKMYRGNSPNSQAAGIISDLWKKNLTQEHGGENPLIVLLAKLKQQYANDPEIGKNQVVQELFKRVPEVWWQEEA